jgi:hypothetical protein
MTPRGYLCIPPVITVFLYQMQTAICLMDTLLGNHGTGIGSGSLPDTLSAVAYPDLSIRV